MSQLGDLLRETAEGNRSGSERSMILGLLEEDPMDGGDRASSKWRTLKRRLRLDWVGCCAGLGLGLGPPTLRLRPTGIPIAVGEEEDGDEEMGYSGQTRVADLSNTDRGTECLRSGTRNLAEALAAERLARGENETETSVAKVPLMRLLAEADGCDTTTWLGSDPVCCVCMGREKGAAFIPCGHTYCRVCSREIWMNRGKCPLCNRSIFDVLHLY